MAPGAPPPSRTVHTGDALAFLRRGPLPADHAVVTSLPDVSGFSPRDLGAWSAWFTDTVALICGIVAPQAVAVFFQSDVHHEGRWVDKSALVSAGAARAGAACLFHRIVCRAPPGTPTRGRPAYAHLQAFSRELRLPRPAPVPDVLPGLGEMPWAQAMGTAACEAVCRFLRAETTCRTVVDPFCGLGTMLAVANQHGLDAIGVERSPVRAARARTLVLGPARG